MIKATEHSCALFSWFYNGDWIGTNIVSVNHICWAVGSVVYQSSERRNQHASCTVLHLGAINMPMVYPIFISKDFPSILGFCEQLGDDKGIKVVAMNEQKDHISSSALVLPRKLEPCYYNFAKFEIYHPNPHVIDSNPYVIDSYGSYMSLRYQWHISNFIKL